MFFTTVFAQEKTVEQIIQEEQETLDYQARDGKKRVKYSVKVAMVPDHVAIRARKFKDEVNQQARRFNIDPAVAMAVMHTESYFNPSARSHIPAYGLMQLVPRSGARNAYIFI